VTALETGLRNAVVELLNKSESFVANLKLVNLLDKYLPLLADNSRATSGRLAMSAADIARLHEIRKRRNGVAHSGEIPSDEEIEGVLILAWDVLWLLDYYAGFDWAAWNMSPGTARKWSAL
jgi:hypothetical protein